MTQHSSQDDPSNGYEAVALQLMAGRDRSIGVATLRRWARALPARASVLDLGCGDGIPISATLAELGCCVHGIDASPTLAAAFRANLRHAKIACEAVETSRFFDRQFDAILAVGLVFLLSADAQRALIPRAAAALKDGGRFLFTAPAEQCEWVDVLTGRRSLSIGLAAYRALGAAAGLLLVGAHVDEGQNHYHDFAKSS